MRLLKHTWKSFLWWKGWRQFTSWRIASILFALSGVIFGTWSYLIGHDLAFDWKAFAADYGISISMNLISLVVAVLAIDWLNERRIIRERKRDTILRMGSHVHDEVIEMVRIAKLEGWLYDGSLKGAALEEANLHEAYLEGADFQEACLSLANLREARLTMTELQQARLDFAKLQGAHLYDAYLQRANLRNASLENVRLNGASLQETILDYANLQGAWLICTDLRGTHMLHANLQGAIMADVRFDQLTILPDGTNWTPEADMKRFTDPSHPNFWRSDNLGSPAYHAGVSRRAQKMGTSRKQQKPG